MPTCQADPALERVSVAGFNFPLGAYPVEAMTPSAGYTLHFEAADTDEKTDDWEEWPDRYVFDIVVTADRTKALCRALLALFPGRIFPILDVLGQDAYREIDPYISYDLIGLDRFTDALRAFADFFFEDGMCGFGCMSEEPFLYLFVDEHKIVTVRAEPTWKDKILRVLEAFDLEQKEEPAGADSAAHEHRGVLIAPPDRSDLLTFEEIVEFLKEDWRLLLNVDPDSNIDDAGQDLGLTPWRVVVRIRSLPPQPPADGETSSATDTDPTTDPESPSSTSPSAQPAPALPEADAEEDPPRRAGRKTKSPHGTAAPREDDDPTSPATPPPLPAESDRAESDESDQTPSWKHQARYAEILLATESLRDAEEMAIAAAYDLIPEDLPDDDLDDPFIAVSDRVTERAFFELVAAARADETGRKAAPGKRKGDLRGPLEAGRVYSARLL